MLHHAAMRLAYSFPNDHCEREIDLLPTAVNRSLCADQANFAFECSNEYVTMMIFYLSTMFHLVILILSVVLRMIISPAIMILLFTTFNLANLTLLF